MTIWFTSDWHLSHKNIMKYSKRPFETVEEMNDEILLNYNRKVKKNDDVYILGDFSFRLATAEEFLQSMNGNIHFILGNHDRRIKQILRKYCVFVTDFHELKTEGKNITLCHYPLYSYNKSHFNAYSLYGHHHSDVSSIVQGKRMNVGVDQNNFQPISFEDVESYMANRENNWDYIPKKMRR